MEADRGGGCQGKSGREWGVRRKGLAGAGRWVGIGKGCDCRSGKDRQRLPKGRGRDGAGRREETGQRSGGELGGAGKEERKGQGPAGQEEVECAWCGEEGREARRKENVGRQVTKAGKAQVWTGVKQGQVNGVTKEGRITGVKDGARCYEKRKFEHLDIGQG